MKKLLFFLPFILPGFLVPAETHFLPVIPRYRVALTFDDGPRPRGTERLQKLLTRHDVKATFFLVGRMAYRHPELVRLLADSGHQLGGHSWSHSDIRKMSPATLKMELELTRLWLKHYTGQDSYYFRPPGGTEKYLRTRFRSPERYHLVMWDVHSLDHDGRPAEEIARRIEERVQDGDVILLHNNLETTVQALETVIPHLKARGFEFVTVSQLAGL